MSNEHDPRYGRVEEMVVVLNSDREVTAEVVCPNQEVADAYIAGQWSDEWYSTEKIRVIRELPERRPLYILSGTLPYPAGPAPRELDDFSAQGEFPGIGNGALVPLDRVEGSLSTHLGRWNIRVYAWDRAAADATFDELVAEATQKRNELVAAFSRFRTGMLVVRPDGAVLRRTIDRFHGTPCWDVAGSHRFVYDTDLDPAELRIVHEPEEESQ